MYYKMGTRGQAIWGFCLPRDLQFCVFYYVINYFDKKFQVNNTKKRLSLQFLDSENIFITDIILQAIDMKNI